MLEPALVQTRLCDGIVRGVEAGADDECINDIERSCAREYLKKFGVSTKLPPDDIAAKLLEIIEAEKPVLRYQIPEDWVREYHLDLLSDTTGEKSVATQLKRITGDNDHM